VNIYKEGINYGLWLDCWVIYFLLKRYGNLDYYDVKAIAFICEGNYYYFDELNIEGTMIYQKTHRLSVYDRDEFENLYNTVITDQAMLPTKKHLTVYLSNLIIQKCFILKKKQKKYLHLYMLLENIMNN